MVLFQLPLLSLACSVYSTELPRSVPGMVVDHVQAVISQELRAASGAMERVVHADHEPASASYTRYFMCGPSRTPLLSVPELVFRPIGGSPASLIFIDRVRSSSTYVSMKPGWSNSGGNVSGAGLIELTLELIWKLALTLPSQPGLAQPFHA